MKEVKIDGPTARIRGHATVTRLHRSGIVTGQWSMPNLVTDRGLDRIAQTLDLEGLGETRAYLAVGTGSAAPTVDDVQLEAEVARTRENLDLVDYHQTDVITNGHVTLTYGRAFDFDEANGNLTEFGLGWGTSGDVATRALFRDGNGDPTTITKTDQEQLVVSYTIELEVAPVVETPVVGGVEIAGVGTLDATHTFCGPSPDSFPTSFRNGVYEMFLYGSGDTSIVAYDGPPDMAFEQFERSASGSGPYEDASRDPYVEGSYERIYRVTIPAGQAYTCYGYALGSVNSQGWGNHFTGFGYKIAFADGQEFPVTVDEELSLALKLTVSR